MPNDNKSPPPNSTANGSIDHDSFDKSSIADLVAEHGSSSASAWLEFERYKIWRASSSDPISQSSFPPVQGYMRSDPYLFAWGNPLVSDPSALEPTAKAFVAWVESQDLRPIWPCVDHDLERVLGGPKFEWSTVNCIYEDNLDPAHIVQLTSPDAKGQEGGASSVKDLKKNIRRADKEDVVVKEVKPDEWSEEDKKQIEKGIQDWKESKSGLQLASTSLQPWLDSDHRRYWVARKDNKAVGVLILTPIQPNSYQIKNALSFPDAPKGTSERLIYTALEDLNAEEHFGDQGEQAHVTVTFGISAADSMNPVENLGGWRVSALSKTYKKVAHGAGLLKRGDFRNKFDSEHEPMYVCYPQDGFGLEGVNALLKLLKK